MIKELQYANMRLTVELITPQIASEMLKRNIDNRRVRQKVVDMYAGDMARNEWERKPSAICFDDEGSLGNGQHTLNAIAASGVPQECLIARNCTRSQIAAMDRGLMRTITDIGHFVGVDMSRAQVAIARVLVYGVEDEKVRSFTEMLEAYTLHEEAITFAVENARSKSAGLSSPVLSVVAAAWYTKDRDDLVRFLEIMRTGLSKEPRDTTVVRLRDFCHGPARGGARSIRAEIHKKAKSSLDAYLSGKSYSKLYGTDRELFPVPKRAKK